MAVMIDANLDHVQGFRSLSVFGFAEFQPVWEPPTPLTLQV